MLYLSPFVLDSSGASKMAVWASMIKLILRKHTTIPTISTAGTARWWTFAAADHGVPGGLPHDEWQVGRHSNLT